jgi:hypothetical protein
VCCSSGASLFCWDPILGANSPFMRAGRARPLSTHYFNHCVKLLLAMSAYISNNSTSNATWHDIIENNTKSQQGRGQEFQDVWELWIEIGQSEETEQSMVQRASFKREHYSNSSSCLRPWRLMDHENMISSYITVIPKNRSSDKLVNI